MFSYQRKSTSGVSIPLWLTTPGPVLLKRHVRNSKYDPLVDEVNLLEANPQYAHVQFPDGRPDTVSIKHLAPLSNKEILVQSDDQSSSVDIPQIAVDTPPSTPVDTPQIEEETQVRNTGNTLNGDHQPPRPLRRSEGQRNTPDRLVYV